MSSPSTIRIKANNIQSASKAFDGRRKRCKNFVGETTSWWQGSAGGALREEFLEIEGEINSFLNKVSTLETKTRTLAKKVKYADDERRRKAREAALSGGIPV
ncbi:MAG: WXG100 family type VII secretion target [Eubacteriales bacterium]